MVQAQFVILIALLLVSSGISQQQAAFAGPPGWRMVDRFYGFRYELTGEFGGDSDFETVVQTKADEMGCFGWIQHTHSNTMAGEMRCNVNRGPLMEAFIKSGADAAVTLSEAKIKVYKDTKIRLHFSSFKVLPRDRDTCFIDPPHQCVKEGATTGTGDEL